MAGMRTAIEAGNLDAFVADFYAKRSQAVPAMS
jgi:queuine/archaeosine tRNA-ribosyltransferase